MNWIELKALHNLYECKEVARNQTLSESEEFRFLINSLGVVDKTSKKLFALDGFGKVYEDHYQKRFDCYHKFLSENGFLKPQSRFELGDLDILMKIQKAMEFGDLKELREQIIAADESLRGISQMFFRNEKYLLNKPSVIDALKQILQIDHFSIEKDQQYIYKLECYQPKAIVLCENLDFLTKPNKPRKYNIELWYAGGKNIQKLDYADRRGLSIFYSCDWDYDGLFIYSLVKEKIPEIQLLTPSGEPKSIKETEHNSHWSTQHLGDMCGLNPYLFDGEQTKMVNQLILDDKWIIEESNDLILMLQKQAGFILADI